MTVYELFLDLPKFVDYRDKVVKHPTKKFPVLAMSSKTENAVHHSLTKIGLSGSNALGYSRYQVNTLGWPGIGYSYVIEPDGTIKFCNPINWRTYHVGNSNNKAIGIVLTGDFRTDKVTDAQKLSLKLLVDRIKKDQKQVKAVKSHHEFQGYAWKECCIFNYKQILEETIANPTSVKLTNDGKYTVQEGDTFWSIAKGKDFEVVELEHANPGVDPRGLKIGKVITLPSAGNKANPQEKQSTDCHGNSIQKYLESIGEDGSYENRAKLAEKYGIKGYKGTAKQNLQLFNIIRDGAKAPNEKDAKSSGTTNNVKGGIADFQRWLNTNYNSKLILDNSYGPLTNKATIRALQTEINRQYGANLVIDGLYGPDSRKANNVVKREAKGNITRIIQGILIAKGYDPRGFDGSFGSGLEAAIKQFQKDNNLSVDGLVGLNTWNELLK